MYMFFWFFKQLYYCLRRIFKSGILLLIVFFIAFLFIFIKPCFAVDLMTLKSNVPGNSKSYNVPSFETLPDEYYSKLSNGFIIHTYTYQSHNYYALILAKNSSAYFYRDGSNSRIGLKGDFREFWPSWNSTSWGNGSDASRDKTIMTDTIYYGSTIYSNYNKTSVFFTYTPPFTEPFIENDSSLIENWSFDNLIINCGSVNPDSSFYLHCDYEGYTFSYDDLNQYKTISNNKAILTIPKSLLNQSIVLRNGFNFSFSLQANKPNMQVLYYELGSYTMNLTSEEQTQINEDSDKQVLSDINKSQQQTNNKLDNLNNSQQETTQAVENLENTVTDSNLQDDSVFFPTLDVPDLARDGLTHIFDAFVLAFCSKTPEDIILPIPYTNKSITIPYNYTREMLTNYSPNLLNIITLFWWYWIARIIVFDIYDKMDKLQSGDVENLQKENVTTNML